jgi:hypothetical protein
VPAGRLLPFQLKNFYSVRHDADFGALDRTHREPDTVADVEKLPADNKLLMHMHDEEGQILSNEPPAPLQAFCHSARKHWLIHSTGKKLLRRRNFFGRLFLKLALQKLVHTAANQFSHRYILSRAQLFHHVAVLRGQVNVGPNQRLAQLL